ncbi:hypothetical protein BEWA_027150 [Theileria equi strain WA]|uniref:Uncharacterized protein n=1 Tax=Theileria equi strain WA TaxID=1537102 RepID=L0AXX0_THEEQ|nr:hypothetical protein BEWA_027150 [Theileria equi strain WA]AFZ79866.1 hypothetical protein BEWA_027150 [Theileria equi strain WA]|eukprot:XP_004829532.1 hypothetical protein BEWA_027150 [Theileria equi strain WA]
MSSIDIRNKCPKENEKGQCKDDRVIHAEKGNLPGPAANYGYVTHSIPSGEGIRELTYGVQSLKIDNDKGETTAFSAKYPNLKEVTTYYYTKDTYNKNEIDVPLALRVSNKGEAHYLYLNIGEDHTKWRQVPLIDGLKIPTGGNTNEELTSRLNNQACKLHNLDSVNIYEKIPYKCPCGKTNVTVSPETITDFSGYTKYKHSYDTNANSVRYQSTVLKLKDEGAEDEIPLGTEQIRELFVYYWNADKGRNHRKPLLMEVDVGGTKVPLGNDGNKDNKRWTMIAPEDGDVELKGEELPLKLQEHKCKLFRPVEIDVTMKNHYKNDYCKKDAGKNDECTHTIQVTGYNGHVPTGYGAFRHTYKNDRETKTFTITGFKNGDRLDEKKPPIFDVKEVIVFFSSSCGDTNTPLLVYVSSSGGKDHKWYKNVGTKTEDKWTVESQLGGKDPQEAAKEGLGLWCPGEVIPQQPLPPAPLEPPSTANKCSEVDAIVDPIEKLFNEVTGTLVDLGYVAATEVGLSVTEELLEWNSEIGLDASTLVLNMAGEALGLASTVLASGAKGNSEKGGTNLSVPEHQVGQDSKTGTTDEAPKNPGTKEPVSAPIVPKALPEVADDNQRSVDNGTGFVPQITRQFNQSSTSFSNLCGSPSVRLDIPPTAPEAPKDIKRNTDGTSPQAGASTDVNPPAKPDPIKASHEAFPYQHLDISYNKDANRGGYPQPTGTGRLGHGATNRNSEVENMSVVKALDGRTDALQFNTGDGVYRLLSLNESGTAAEDLGSEVQGAIPGGLGLGGPTALPLAQYPSPISTTESPAWSSKELKAGAIPGFGGVRGPNGQDSGPVATSDSSEASGRAGAGQATTQDAAHTRGGGVQGSGENTPKDTTGSDYSQSQKTDVPLPNGHQQQSTVSS